MEQKMKVELGYIKYLKTSRYIDTEIGKFTVLSFK